MSIGGFSPGVGRFSQALIPEVFDAATKTATISEAKLAGMHLETFWDSLEAQGAEKLVITCKDGTNVIYEKGFFNRLLDAQPELADLTERFTLEFPGGAELKETKAKLLMCGEAFEILNANTIEHETHRVSLKMIPLKDFQEVLKAIDDEVDDISAYPEDVQLAMNFLCFHPIPSRVHGRKDWNARGVDVGEVPPPPKELIEALKMPCPIAKDGSKMIDTHVILWMPPTLNGEPITVNNLEKMATADAFGENKIGYEYCHGRIRTDAVINQPLEKGYWLARYKRPVAARLLFEQKRKHIADNYPGYEMPKTRDNIASSLMQYGCSGDQKERILPWDDRVRFSICEEVVNGYHLVVGAFAPSGLTMQLCYDDDGRVGVCPVKKFFKAIGSLGSSF